MTDEDVTDEPSSEVPESSQDETKPIDESSNSDETEYGGNEVLQTFSIVDILNKIYNERYYWEIFKSTVVFILALKVARECNMMKIPIKDYKPFNRC